MNQFEITDNHRQINIDSDNSVKSKSNTTNHRLQSPSTSSITSNTSVAQNKNEVNGIHNNKK